MYKARKSHLKGGARPKNILESRTRVGGKNCNKNACHRVLTDNRVGPHGQSMPTRRIYHLPTGPQYIPGVTPTFDPGFPHHYHYPILSKEKAHGPETEHVYSVQHNITDCPNCVPNDSILTQPDRDVLRELQKRFVIIDQQKWVLVTPDEYRLDMAKDAHIRTLEMHMATSRIQADIIKHKDAMLKKETERFKAIQDHYEVQLKDADDEMETKIREGKDCIGKLRGDLQIAHTDSDYYQEVLVDKDKEVKGLEKEKEEMLAEIGKLDSQAKKSNEEVLRLKKGIDAKVEETEVINSSLNDMREEKLALNSKMEVNELALTQMKETLNKALEEAKENDESASRMKMELNEKEGEVKVINENVQMIKTERDNLQKELDAAKAIIEDVKEMEKATVNSVETVKKNAENEVAHLKKKLCIKEEEISNLKLKAQQDQCMIERINTALGGKTPDDALFLVMKLEVENGKCCKDGKGCLKCKVFPVLEQLQNWEYICNNRKSKIKQEMSKIAQNVTQLNKTYFSVADLTGVCQCSTCNRFCNPRVRTALKSCNLYKYPPSGSVWSKIFGEGKRNHLENMRLVQITPFK